MKPPKFILSILLIFSLSMSCNAIKLKREALTKEPIKMAHQEPAVVDSLEFIVEADQHEIAMINSSSETVQPIIADVVKMQNEVKEQKRGKEIFYTILTVSIVLFAFIIWSIVAQKHSS
jgi:hypothetical protein